MRKIVKIFPDVQVDEYEIEYETLIVVGTLVDGEEFSEGYSLTTFQQQNKEFIISRLKKNINLAIYKNLDK